MEVRKPDNKDLMDFTRCVIEFTHYMHQRNQEIPSNDTLRERKYWAADRLMDDSETKLLLFAEVNGKVIGYIYAEYDESQKEGRLNEVFVNELYRSQGVDKKLFQHTEDWMKAQGVGEVDWKNGEMKQLLEEWGY